MDFSQNKNHRQKADAIQKKICGDVQPGHNESADSGPDQTREVELRRIQGDGVGQVFFGNQPRHQRLLAGRIQ